ncbi:hypothetical protein OF83DRAFT_1170108, partial [Amylostereum chailletii]
MPIYAQAGEYFNHVSDLAQTPPPDVDEDDPQQQIEQEIEDITQGLSSGSDFLENVLVDGPDDDETGDENPQKRQKIDPTAFSSASEDVIVEATRKAYNQLWAGFVKFCVDTGYTSSTKALDKLVNEKDLPDDFPRQVGLCDDTDIYTGTLKGLDVPRATYAYAQKMRAAISHKFARELGRGAQAWVENPHRKGFYGGNPSLAHSIGQYMISLRRRKTRGGEEAVSAKAITEEVLRRLYEFNINFTGDHDSGSIPREDLKKT